MQLNFWVAPMTPEMMRRTHQAFSAQSLVAAIRGTRDLSWELRRALYPQSCGIYWFAYEKDLPYDKANCYRHKALGSLIFQLAAGHCDGEIQDFDLRSVRLALRALTEDDCCKVHAVLAEYFSWTRWSLSLTERAQAMKLTDKIPPDILSKLEASLTELQQQLTAADPQITGHLRASHALLTSYPETVHLLDDSEIAALIKAAEIHTQVQVVKAAAAKGTRKKLGVEDL